MAKGENRIALDGIKRCNIQKICSRELFWEFCVILAQQCEMQKGAKNNYVNLT